MRRMQCPARPRAHLVVSTGMHPAFTCRRSFAQGSNNSESGVSPMTGRSPESVAEVGAFPEVADAPLSVQATISRYHQSLIQFLRQRLRVPEDAFDVAQETYIRLMQYQDSTQIRSPSSMLFRIAINVAKDHGRAELARRVSSQCSVDDVELISDEPSAERQLSARE